MRAIWGRIASHFRTRYTRELENEIGRLREDNRALVNSILGLAGILPMRACARSASDALVAAAVRPANAAGPRSARLKAASTKAESRGASPMADSEIPPLRRRSWRQLGRVREIEDARAARRERETDTGLFPAPRNIVPRL